MASKPVFMAAVLTVLAATAAEATGRLRIPVAAPGPNVAVSGFIAVVPR
jgi:hypothetical protein